GGPVAGFCGIGNPGAFRRTLADLGAVPQEWRTYPDHHPYTREDVEDLARWARGLPEAALLVTTQKDLVKLRVSHLGGRPLWAVRIALHFTAGQDRLEQLLRGVVPGDG